MDSLISQLSPNVQKALKGLILVRRVEIGSTTVHRKFVKATRSARPK